MKWLIVSDTHGWTQEVAELKKRYEGQVEAFIHCGDSELAPGSREMEGYIAVEGNCDRPGTFPEEVVRTIGPLKFMVAHGHLLGVRNSPAKLYYRGLEEKADVVCFGHTHFAGTFKEGGMIFINPGSLRLPKNYEEGTYAILELSPDQKAIGVTYYTIADEPVAGFSKVYPWKDEDSSSN